jgi:hypothetical protein
VRLYEAVAIKGVVLRCVQFWTLQACLGVIVCQGTFGYAFLGTLLPDISPVCRIVYLAKGSQCPCTLSHPRVRRSRRSY